MKRLEVYECNECGGTGIVVTNWDEYNNSFVPVGLSVLQVQGARAHHDPGQETGAVTQGGDEMDAQVMAAQWEEIRATQSDDPAIRKNNDHVHYVQRWQNPPVEFAICTRDWHDPNRPALSVDQQAMFDFHWWEVCRMWEQCGLSYTHGALLDFAQRHQDYIIWYNGRALWQ